MSVIHVSVRMPQGISKCLDAGNKYRALHCGVISRSAGSDTYLTATNGRVLAIRKCDGESDGNYLVPKEVIEKGKAPESFNAEEPYAKPVSKVNNGS